MSNIVNNTSSTETAESEPHQLIGVFYILHGAFYFVLLIPCLLVIAQKEQLQHSCYKIMLVMTILDIVNLCMASFLSGYYSYSGTQYCCGHEIGMQIAGHFALGLFFAYCAICVLLAFNRFIDIYSDKLAKRLFGHGRTWFWFIGPFTYGAYFLTPLSAPIIYSSQFDIWMFTADKDGERGLFINTINNVVTPIALFILYTLICLVINHRYKMQFNTADTNRISATQIQIIVQSMVICSLTVVSCLSYVSVQYKHFPPALYKLTQIIWQIMHVRDSDTMITFEMIQIAVVLVWTGVYKLRNALGGDRRISAMPASSLGVISCYVIQHERAAAALSI